MNYRWGDLKTGCLNHQQYELYEWVFLVVEKFYWNIKIIIRGGDCLKFLHHQQYHRITRPTKNQSIHMAFLKDVSFWERDPDHLPYGFLLLLGPNRIPGYPFPLDPAPFKNLIN